MNRSSDFRLPSINQNSITSSLNPPSLSHQFFNYAKNQLKNGNMNPKLGKVLVCGNYKKYTHMTNDPEAYSRRYSDARIILSGDIRKIKYEVGE